MTVQAMASRSHVSGRPHHTSTSHLSRPREDEVELKAPPESVASFAAPTVVPGDSVSQIGSRPRHSRSEAPRSHHSHHSSHTYSHRHPHHSSHSRDNAGWDDKSSGLLSEENLEAHNAEERSRASTSRPVEQLYVEVVEDRTATGSYYSHLQTPRQSLHPNDIPARSHQATRSPSPRIETLSRAMGDRLSVSRSHMSARPSHTSGRHVSRSPERHPKSERPPSRETSKPRTVVSRRDHSPSTARSSTSHHTSQTSSRSQSHATTSTLSHASSHTSYRVSQNESPLSRASTPKVREAYEVAVYEEVPHASSPFRDTYTVEVEAAEEQARGRDYKIHHRHEYPVYGDI